MNHLSNELLNKYIDNELSIQELNVLHEHIKDCDMCLSRLKAQKIVEHRLRRIDEFKLPDSFTDLVMKRISITEPSFRFKPRKSYFLRGICFFFGFFILAAFIFGLYLISLSNPASMDSPAWYSGIAEYLKSEMNSYSGFFKSQTFSLIGGVLTFILIISFYFIYDSHRNFKSRINSFR